MDTMAPIRPPTVQRPRRISLTAGPAAAAEARRQVRTAICAWDIPIDPSVAILLTSELVTNAATQWPATLDYKHPASDLRRPPSDQARRTGPKADRGLRRWTA